MILYAKWRDTELPYDAEVEYIGSNGGETSEYINVGIIPST